MRLPVRTALLQNSAINFHDTFLCDYQSERHCSKTREPGSRVRESAITSQNGTAPKHAASPQAPRACAITSQNGTAPKLISRSSIISRVRLPVRTALLQNAPVPRDTAQPVRLPVRTALLQNRAPRQTSGRTVRLPVRTALLQNSLLAWHLAMKCDYQSERHCSKTYMIGKTIAQMCDYQSERHCSKTSVASSPTGLGAITSQNGTAPKRIHSYICSM